MNDTSHDSLNEGEVFGRNNQSIPSNQSDMSGDKDGEGSQRFVDLEKKISPTRTSMVNELADKISLNEYKCKLCSKVYRCRTGTNANMRQHSANAHEKTALFSKSQMPQNPNSTVPSRKNAMTLLLEMHQYLRDPSALHRT